MIRVVTTRPCPRRVQVSAGDPPPRGTLRGKRGGGVVVPGRCSPSGDVKGLYILRTRGDPEGFDSRAFRFRR